jgi:transcription termination factor Rho
MHLSELKQLHVTELLDMASEIDGANRLRKHDLIFALLKNQARKGESIFGEGTLEVLPDGFGFLRSPTTFMSRPRRSAVSTCIPATA